MKTPIKHTDEKSDAVDFFLWSMSEDCEFTYWLNDEWYLAIQQQQFPMTTADVYDEWIKKGKPKSKLI